MSHFGSALPLTLAPTPTLTPLEGPAGPQPPSPELTLDLSVPLDLTFLHEGSKTLVDGLVNIEKLVSGSASVP